MCGIAGLYDADHNLAPGQLSFAVKRMRGALRHRGPDMDGDWIDPDAGVAFGHQRLSIVDLSPSGRQPMISKSGRYVLVYNGEIYNFHEIMADLVSRGHIFRGRSDTEVLLAAVEEYGLIETLRRSYGMFALALWDRKARNLTLARDRMGKKPLYYGLVDGVVVFASELKAVSALGFGNLELDRAALATYLSNQYICSPLSVWKGIAKLPPGCLITIGGAGAFEEMPEVQQWWSMSQLWESDIVEFGNAEEGLAALHTELLTAVSQRLIADRPVGAFLSGGVDSSLVVALMCEASNHQVRTFTVGFSDPDFDETAAAREVAEYLGTDHSELRLDPSDLLELVPTICEIYDEPFADQSAVPMVQMARFAASQVTVALTGDGGDELFAGYARYAFAQRLESLASLMPLRVRRALGSSMRRIPVGFYDWALKAVPQIRLNGLRGGLSGDRILKISSLLEASDRRTRYRQMTSLIDEPSHLLLGDATDACISPSLPAGELRAMMALDSLIYLPDDVLVKVDRATMMAGLEARSPLLDSRVLECAWRMPEPLLRLDGRGKWPLRALLDRYLPCAVADRPKRGFSIPMAAWLRGPLREWAGDMLEPGRLRRTGILQPAAVQSMLDEHQKGARNWSAQLWALLMLEEWNERWNPPTASGRDLTLRAHA